MRKVFQLTTVVILALVLSSVAVLAASLDVKVSPDSKTIRMNETASYTLTISHNEPHAVTVDLFSLDILWDIRTADTLIVPTSGLTTTLTIRPFRALDPGSYGVPLVFKSRSDNLRTEETVLIGLRPVVDVPRLYTPSIRASVDLPAEVDPRDAFVITVNAENLNPRNITDMTAFIRSNLINQEHQVTLAPSEDKQYTFNVELDPRTSPQSDQVYVTLVTEHENRSLRFELKPQALTIAEYGDIEEEFLQTRGFLRVREESKFTNTGNARKTKTIERDAGFLDVLFTTTSPQVESNRGKYSWEVTLDPGESRTIIVESSYWPLFAFFAAILLVVIAYFLFRAPIMVRKEVRKLGSKELRVSIFVKNRSARTVQNVTLVERVNKVFRLGEHFGPGKVKPAHIAKLMSKRTNDYRGTRVRWDLGALGSGEEVVAQYTIHSQVDMIGTVTLPPIVAHYQAGEKQAEVKSNESEAKVGRL